MRKLTWILAFLLSLSSGALWARDGEFGGGGDRGGGGGGWSGGGDRGGGENSSGPSAGSTDSSDHSTTHNDHVYSHSTHTNGGSVRSGNNGYYRQGGTIYSNGQVRHFNRSYGSNGYSAPHWNNGHFNQYSTSPHHFNTSVGASYGQRSFASNKHLLDAPRPLGHGSLLPRSLQHSPAHLPSQGPGGRAFSGSLVSPNRMNSSVVRNQMSSIARNSAFSARVAAFNHSETIPNHYYWHQWGGGNFCHFYDRWGCNWYGWGWGGAFFWTQWYGNNWWWYDSWNSRWCYWWGDGWWWQDPATTTVYIYQNGDYAPSDQSNANGNGGAYNPPSNGNGEESYSGGDGNNLQPGGNMTTGSGDGENSNAPMGVVEFASPDQTRTVKLMGDSGDAFLYDSAEDSFKPLFLESDVKNVKFSKDKKGKIEIELILNDGSIEKFDGQGQQLKDADSPKDQGTKAEVTGGASVEVE